MELRSSNVVAAGCVITWKPSALRYKVVGCVLVLLWGVTLGCSAQPYCLRRCVCVLRCVCVFAKLRDHWAWQCLGWRLELDRQMRGCCCCCCVVEGDPWGLKSQLYPTSNLPPPPLAVTNTQTHMHRHIHRYALGHTAKLKYYAHACMGRYHKCTYKTGHTHTHQLFKPPLQEKRRKEKTEWKEWADTCLHVWTVWNLPLGSCSKVIMETLFTAIIIVQAHSCTFMC